VLALGRGNQRTTNQAGDEKQDFFHGDFSICQKLPRDPPLLQTVIAQRWIRFQVGDVKTIPASNRQVSPKGGMAHRPTADRLAWKINHSP
jgi:hypothetical protein